MVGKSSVKSTKRSNLQYCAIVTIVSFCFFITIQYSSIFFVHSKMRSFINPPMILDLGLEHQHSLWLDKIPSKEKAEIGIRYPYFSQQCFKYMNLTAEFNCTQAHPYEKYTNDLIMVRSYKLWELVRDKNVSDPWRVSPSSSPMDKLSLFMRPSIHLVMVGDSHIRNIFEVLVERILGPRVKYRLSTFEENEWKDTEIMPKLVRETRHIRVQEILHLDCPLKITYHWDPVLDRLPGLIQKWTSIKSSRRPTHLLVGGTLHHIFRSRFSIGKTGPKNASEGFVNKMKKIVPLLTSFSKIAPTVYKQTDHLQDLRIIKYANRTNIDFFNQIVVDLLPESNTLALWHSGIPLSDLYCEECRIRFKKTPDNMWKCHDKQHIGYIMIEQYVDMYLNYVFHEAV